MSKSRHPQDSWRAWGEYRKERDRLEDFDNWKQEAVEDLEMNRPMGEHSKTTRIYVVKEEWQPLGLDVDLDEVVGAFFSEEDAWEVLDGLAHDRGIKLPIRDTSFTVPNPDDSTEYSTFFIDIMEVHGS